MRNAPLACRQGVEDAICLSQHVRPLALVTWPGSVVPCDCVPSLPPKVGSISQWLLFKCSESRGKKFKCQEAPPSPCSLPRPSCCYYNSATMAQPFLLALPDILSGEGTGRAFLSKKGPDTYSKRDSVGRASMLGRGYTERQ